MRLDRTTCVVKLRPVEQDNEASVNFVKRTLNYFIYIMYRTSVTDELMATYYPNEREPLQSVYMSMALLSEMHEE